MLDQEKPEPLEGIRRSRLEGTTVAGGARSRQRFSKLLGIPVLRDRSIEVRAIAWVSDHVEVEISQGETSAVVFSIERFQQDRPCFVSAGHLSLFYRGRDLDPKIDAIVRAVVPRAFEGKTIEILASLIAADPETGRATEPLPATPEGDQQDYDQVALLSTWGSSAVWTSFFANAEVARSQLDSLDFFERCTFVQHCDLECLCVNPQVGAPTIPVVLYPWDDRVRRLDWPREEESKSEQSKPHGPGMVTTDLNEKDVILGRGPEKLAEALDHLETQKVGDMVFCSTTCVPVVSGDDVDAVLSTYRDRFDVPLLDLTTTPQSMQGVFRELLVTRRLEAEGRVEKVQQGYVNLIGFPEEPSLDELRNLLIDAGVHINATLLPALSPELIDQLPKAPLNVFHPNALWRGLYDQLQFDSALESISPPAPYGRADTAKWIERVAEKAGLDASQTLHRVLRSNVERWTSLTKEANAHRLGFVIRAADIRFLTDPAQTWGTPLLHMIEEMGFHVAVLVFAEPDEERGIQEALERSWSAKNRLEVKLFRARQELIDLVKTVNIDALYSEHFYDRRVSELGLAGFSGQYFERGIDGATRTLRRLLEVCKIPFFRRYSRPIRRASRIRGTPDPLGQDDETSGVGRHDHRKKRTH